MTIILTQQLKDKLQSAGVSTLLNAGTALPDEVIFEPPCSLKWMNVNHSLHIGAFSYAVSGFYFACRIGRYCSFGEQVQIGRHPHPMHWVSTSPFFYWQFKNVLDQELPSGVSLDVHTDFIRNGPPVVAKITVIENDVWIGHGAFILPGVHVGNGAVIAAMSVVTKDVPPYAIVAGSPAKVIRYRFSEDQIKMLQASKWWEFAPWHLKGAELDNIPVFLEFIEKIRASSEDAYVTEKIKLSDLT